MLHIIRFEQTRRAGERGAETRLARVLFATVASGLVATTVGAQSTASKSLSGRQSVEDPRWLPWLGCWQADTSGSQGTVDARVTCVVPGEGVSTIDLISLTGGRVVARERLDASGRPHAVDQAGCQGFETAEWSPGRVRVYVRSDYDCSGVRATSTRLLAISPTGEWLDAQAVNAGGGTITHVVRRRDVGPPAGAPSEVSRALDRRQMAVAAARAAAAAPLTTNDVVEAVREVDPSVVRDWIIASGSRFSLSGAQATALVQANVPASVLQAMMGDTRTDQERVAAEAYAAADEYLRASSATTMVLPGPGYAYTAPEGYMCPPPGYCAPNPYSAYNGYSYYGYDGYGYSPAGFPYSPFYGGLPIIITTNGNRGNGFHNHGPVVHPNGGKPVGVGGGRPSGAGRGRP